MDQREHADQAGDGAAVGETLATVSGMLDDLAGVAQIWRLDDSQVADAAGAAYQLSTRLHALGLELVGEIDRRGVATAVGAPSTQAWLRQRRLCRPEHAKRDLGLARLMPDPGTSPASPVGPAAEATVGAATGAVLTAGTISVEHAAVIAKALTELPSDLAEATRVAFETEMVAYAHRVDPRELTIFGHHLLERIDPESADEALAKQLERERREAARKRSATRFADGHGSVFYKLRVTEEDDTRIWPVLDTLAAPRPGAGGSTDTRTAAQRLADAFVEAFTRVSLDGGLPGNGGDRPRVLLTISLTELVTGLGAGLDLETGAVLSPATLRRLACDAQVIPAVLGGAGQVLDLGHARRTFDGPARLAVIARDGGCIHPGCDRPARWCDVHHVVPWWRGGRTDQDNGVVLCGFHHRLYDDETWGIRFAADGIPEAVPPAWVDAARTPVRHNRFLTRRRPRAA